MFLGGVEPGLLVTGTWLGALSGLGERGVPAAVQTPMCHHSSYAGPKLPQYTHCPPPFPLHPAGQLPIPAPTLYHLMHGSLTRGWKFTEGAQKVLL